MKICTDATLFGAMAPIQGGERVLDIGAGCGLLALMVAQLGAGLVTAVEITEEAYQEAFYNFAQSPWVERFVAVRQDIQSYAAECDDHFDLIISNPPFFDRHTKSGSDLRSIARHTDTLPFEDLLVAVDKLLGAEGQFYLLIPTHAVERVCAYANEKQLYLSRRVDLANHASAVAKVSALLFNRETTVSDYELLPIYENQRVYSDASAHYLRPFLLRFADPQLT